MVGVLRVLGTIDLAQFWPDGEADADTSKVKVNVNRSSFSFAPDGKKFKKTDVYFGAFSQGASKKQVVDNQDRITVRLQGIDAPELHYRAAALRRSDAVSDAKREKFNLENKPQRRQYWAETATVALAAKLSGFGPTVKCQVTSFIDQPFEVIDTYGRFVANIRVGAGYKTDVNLWLAEEGWAYPTFYSSMKATEIEAYLKAIAKHGRKRRIWKDYSLDTSKFDPKLVYRPLGPIDEAKDKGKVLMPKLFRRQLSFRMQKKAGVFSGNFIDYLKANRDSCFKTDDFLKQGKDVAPVHSLHDFMKGTKFTVQPQDIVFREKYSNLVDAGGNRIEAF